MQQYIIDGELLQNLILEKKLYKYLVKVIRLKINAEIIIFNGKEKAIYKAINISKTQVELLKIQNLELLKDNIQITLGIGILKKDKLEWVLQKTTELGINNIILLNLENSIAKFDSTNIKKKERYTEIIKSAAEQSKRDSIPKLIVSNDIKKMEYSSYDYIFLAHEKIQINDFWNYLTEIKKYENIQILVLIGPEGGFSEKEVHYFKTLDNLKLISLGTNILRAETAAISIVSSINLLR